MKQRASGDVRRTGAAAHIDMGCPGSRQHSNERRPRAQNKEKPMYILNQQKQIIYLYQDCKQIHTNKCHNNNNSSRHHTQQEKKFIEEVLHIVNSKNRCLKYVIQELPLVLVFQTTLWLDRIGIQEVLLHTASHAKHVNTKDQIFQITLLCPPKAQICQKRKKKCIFIFF